MGRFFQILGAVAFVVVLAVMPNVHSKQELRQSYMDYAVAIIIAGIGVAIHRLERLERMLEERSREAKNV